jgi:hypothetical protein
MRACPARNAELQDRLRPENAMETIQELDPAAAELEDQIRRRGIRVALAFELAQTTGDASMLEFARECHAERAALVAQRTPETIAKLERERGLR